MPFTDPHATLRTYSATTFEVVEPIVYNGREETFTVPAGFVSDLASVPSCLTWLIARYGVYTLAALLHDMLCRLAHAGLFSRADADGIFRRVLREAGVSWPRRWVMWAAVRLGGGFSGGIGALDLLRFLLVAAVAVPVIIVPTAVVALWQLGFLLFDWAFVRPFSPRR